MQTTHPLHKHTVCSKSHFVIFLEQPIQTEATTIDENFPTIVENSAQSDEPSPNDENSTKNVENNENLAQNVENDDTDNFVDVDEVDESIEKKVEMNPDEVEESDNVRHLREVKSSGTRIVHRKAAFLRLQIWNLVWILNVVFM